MATPNCQGHQKRTELRDKVSKERKREARAIDASMELNIRRGAGKLETMSLHHLKEEERKSNEWKLMEKQKREGNCRCRGRAKKK